MTIYELENRRKELGYSYGIIAMFSGVEVEKIEALFSENATTTITYEERNAIEKVLKKPDIDTVCEARPTYLAKKQGEFNQTYKIYERRRERILDCGFEK